MTRLLCLLALGCLAHAPSAAPDSALDAPLGSPLVDLRPLEVRVRKLHVVRPDLLQFPIPYDVIC